MYRNLFAACLLLSIGFHVIIAGLVIAYKPAGKRLPFVFVQNVSLVESLRSGTDAIKKSGEDKTVWKIPGPEKVDTASGPENVQSVRGSSYMKEALDAQAHDVSEISRSGNVYTNPANEKGGEALEAGTAGQGTKGANGENEYALAGGAPGGIQYDVTKARLLKAPDIRYDEISRRRGEEGSVSIDLEIDKSGNPRNVKIKRSSGYPRLDRVAMNGISSSRFSPTMKSGRPVDSEVEFTIIFRLDDIRTGLKVVEDDKVNILE
ncbi:MAG TPA: energy transducer TonB [Desulfomonilia bacterium]